MNIEDGHDLPLRVRFHEEGGTPYWRAIISLRFRMSVTPSSLAPHPRESGMSCEGSTTMSARQPPDRHHRCTGDLTTNRLFPAKGPNMIEITILMRQMTCKPLPRSRMSSLPSF